MIENTDKINGTVKWFDYKNGFGYVEPDDPNMNDIYIPRKAIKNGIKILNCERVTCYINEDGETVSVIKKF